MTSVAIVLLILIFGMALLVSLVTYAFFWYEAANSTYEKQLRERYGKRLGWYLLRGVFSGFVSSVITILIYPIGMRRKATSAGTGRRSAGPHLILIHGLYHNSSAWVFLRRRFRRAGFSRITDVNYSSFKHDFWEIVEIIDQHIARLADTEKEQVILIGHSLGGLLAKAWVGTRDGGSKVSGLIALGSPHQGSKLAVLGCGALARSISYRGRVVQELQEQLSAVDLPQLALYSPVDNMVLPADALKATEPGWTHVETEAISHVAMLYHKGTADAVIRMVQEISHQN
jgi:pimeloyl-ACP methyl ester carboxylesterase